LWSSSAGAGGANADADAHADVALDGAVQQLPVRPVAEMCAYAAGVVGVVVVGGAVVVVVVGGGGAAGVRIVPGIRNRFRHHHQTHANVVVVGIDVVVVLGVLGSAAVQTIARAAATPSGGSAAAHAQ